MLKTLKPEEFNSDSPVTPGVVKRLNPAAIAAARERAVQRTKGVLGSCVMCGDLFVRKSGSNKKYCTRCAGIATLKRDREHNERRKALREIEQATTPAPAPRTSAHWHFRIAADGRPTCWLPTLVKPRGRHVCVPMIVGESPFDAMDRYVTGWGDKDSPSRKLQWRDE